ncbi:MAG: 4Fe-4S dicluster domain-containing protein [Gammaproteobacteria bacterium]
MERQFPTATYHFRYKHPPTSGNIINGAGNPDKVQAVQIFHSSGFRQIEWHALELFFLLTMPFRLFIRGLLSRGLLRKADGKISKNKRPVPDKQAMATEIKRMAMELNAGAVGITTLPANALYQNVNKDYKYAISIAYPMNFQVMEKYITQVESGIEAIRAYHESTRIVVRLAAYIRKLGWPARAYCEGADILHIPIAIEAGIGELGKHGSLINKELGSDFRLATILTDLPLATDKPVDIAVDDLCLRCQRCTLDCPADAISDKKQLVRGVEKWYVDFDRCAPYFSMTYGCGICIQVCPWSKPGRGPGLAATLLAKREKNSDRKS